jgi:hypothetical protein
VEPRALRQIFRVVAFGIAVASCAPQVSAQSTGRIAAGLGFTGRQPIRDDSRGSAGVNFIWRLGQGREGWGYRYGLNWYSTYLERTIGDTSTQFGKLSVRPIMGGYGYTHLMGRAAVSTNVLAGYAFTGFSMDSLAREKYRALVGGPNIHSDVRNTAVIKPEVSAWINLSDKLGANLGVGYMIARPEVTITSVAGRDRRRVVADTLMIKIGLVYSVY